MISSRIKKLLILTAILALILVALFAFRTKPVMAPAVPNPQEILRSRFSQGKILIEKNKVSLNVYLAKTSKERSDGLSPFLYLKESEGMLFIFETLSDYGFWMKDMDFAIDMIWLDENFKIVDIKKNATPASYPEVFKPEELAKYVLEVNTGFAGKNNLNIGDKIIFAQ